MTDTDNHDRREDLKSRFSGLHIRTYEAELLISGAVVFGLFRLAPAVSRYFETVGLRLEGNQRAIAIYGEMYLGMVIYALVGAFLLHLVMRAIWIGLLGLESVFPDGISWEKFKAGPFFKEHSRRRLGSLAENIERFDDLCSLIFGFGFIIVVVFLYSIVILLFCALSGILVSRLIFEGRFYPRIFWTTFALFMAFQILPNLIDRTLGERMRPDSLPGKILARLVAWGWDASPNRWIGQIQFTLQSNTSNTRVAVALIVVMVSLSIVFVGGVLVRGGVLGFDSLAYFPSNLRESGLDPRHYLNLRPADDFVKTFPWIQSEVIEGPYLKLSIPYYPRRHNPLIRKHCPGVEPFRTPGFFFGRGDPADSSAIRETIECLASFSLITLDGNELPDLRFDFTREPGNGRESIATYFPVADLEDGRHELVVTIPSRDMAEDVEDAKPDRHVIPFWR